MVSQRSFPFPISAACWVVALFILKASLTGLWVVRPWDVPDEVGHFSYIKDLATGRGLPVLHDSFIDEEIWHSFAPENSPNPGQNWIAQHPPLYHLLMVPAYGIGSLFGDSFWGSFYLIRTLTAVLFGIGIWAFMKALGEAGFRPGVILGMGIMVGSIPNHTYLAGAVNHDALVFLFGCLVLLFWIRFMKSNSEKNLMLLALVLGMGGIVKYTFLVLLPPIVFWTGVESVWSGSFNWKSFVRFLLLTFLPIGLWIGRNLLLLGEPLPVDTTGFHSDNPWQLSFLEFGQEYPVFSVLLQSFWGLLGWMGDGTLQVRWLQTYSIYQQAFTWPVLILLGITLFFLVYKAWPDRRCVFACGGGSGLLVIAVYFSGWIQDEYPHYRVLFYLGFAVVGWIITAFILELFQKKQEIDGRLYGVCLVVSCLFMTVHVLSIFKFSVSAGSLQGTFGRYYLPVLCFAIMGLLGFGLKHFRYASHLVLTTAMVYTCVELYVWLHEAIPFFRVYE